MNIIHWLLYITNNESVSRHEQGFDIAFFTINTAAVVFGGIYLGYIGEWQWIPFLVIEYTWAVDTMRHNRPKRQRVLTCSIFILKDSLRAHILTGTVVA